MLMTMAMTTTTAMLMMARPPGTAGVASVVVVCAVHSSWVSWNVVEGAK
jgi:hypothetical protein